MQKALGSSTLEDFVVAAFIAASAFAIGSLFSEEWRSLFWSRLTERAFSSAISPLGQQQLQSLSKQTLLPAELIICDDTSVDATVDIIKRFSESAPFPSSSS